MKKIAIYLMTALLMINLAVNNKTYATTEPPPPETESAQPETPPVATEAESPQPETPPEPEAKELENEQAKSALQATAVVIEVGEIHDFHTDYAVGKVQEVKVEILDGELETKEFSIDYMFSYGMDEKNTGCELEVGDKVSVQISKDENGSDVATIQDVIRNHYILVIFAIFLALVLLIMGKQGIKAVLGLLGTLIMVYFLLIKSIFLGYNAIFMTFLCTIFILLFHSILSMGFRKKALVVVLGTLISCLLSGMIAMLFAHLAKLSGTHQDTIMLSMNMTNVEFYWKDLIFAGMMMVSLGVCMNFVMLMVNKIDEIKSKTEDMSRKELLKKGMKIGRELVGDRINTLILIYIGSSFIILFIFLGCNLSLRDVFNKETIAENALSAIAGSIGLVLTVPITSVVYATFNHRKTIYKMTSENKLDGNRSLKL